MRTLAKVLLDLLHGDMISSAFVPLLDFQLNDVGDTHVRYARYASNITYNGDLYTGWPFSAKLLGGSKGSAVPTYTLAIADAVRELRTHAIATNWFRGSFLTIAVVCVDHLTEDYGYSTVTYDILKAAPQQEAVHLKIGGPNTLKMRSPHERYWCEQCPYAASFPDDPRCGYSGVETECNGTIDDCIDRGRETRFGGFLGLDSDGDKLVIPARIS